DHANEVVAAPGFGARSQEARDLVERFEIFLDRLADARPRPLSRDGAAVAQRGAMHLSERCSRDRLFLEDAERLRQPRAKLFFDNTLHVGDSKWVDVVLETGERFEVRGRQQVGAAGEDLPELDEGRPERFEIVRELV